VVRPRFNGLSAIAKPGMMYPGTTALNVDVTNRERRP